MITMIVATSLNNCIGINGKMPWHSAKDLKYFKEMTLGYPIVMGRKTYESIGKPLVGRENIILTTQPNYKVEGAKVCHTVEDILKRGKDEKLFIIGGGEIYKYFKPYAQTLYITLVGTKVQGDTYFIDYKEDFVQVEKRKDQDRGLELTFTKWIRK